MRKRSWSILGGLLGCSLFYGAAAAEPVDALGHKWWQHAVFYEVYPRSFADTNGDGIGDLKGITQKMAYLHDLGVDAIWITPFYPSPNVDFGYDISDYEAIDPMYGTMADFDRMIAEGKKRGVGVILDLVLNHTSEQHPWFVESRSSKTSAKRDWYVWRDGQGPGQPPSNWTSLFGGSCWRYDEKTHQYFYHYFYPEQPDLNWHNPAVEKAMLDMTRSWFKRGIAGYRLDAVDTLFEDPNLTDNPVLPGKNAYGDPNTEEIHNKRFPELHDVLKKVRSVAKDYDGVLIGETWTLGINELKAYYGKEDELQLPMDFMFMNVNKLSPPDFRRRIAEVDSAGGWPFFVIGNHDNDRSYNRYGDGKNNDAIAKLMGAFYLTLRGTPLMFYGEEIGMENNNPTRKEDVKDPVGRVGWPEQPGRDGERTPMQWTADVNAGFSQAKPWLPVPPSYKTHNVATESKTPTSIYSVYKKVLALRHTHPALLEGSYTALNEDDAHVMSYLRSYQDKAVLVALNMSGEPHTVVFDLKGKGIPSGTFKPLMTTPQASAEGTKVSLPPFGVFIADVVR